MAFIRKMTALGTALAMAAVLFGAFAASASAQAVPFTAYGSGLTAGDTVGAWVGGVACGETTVDADGNWVLQISSTDPCAPTAGSEIAFSINGVTANETATFAEGGTPADVAAGITLTAGAGETPAPAETGNAGLLGSTGTSMALVLALGVFAAAMVAGGRTATRRS